MVYDTLLIFIVTVTIMCGLYGCVLRSFVWLAAGQEVNKALILL